MKGSLITVALQVEALSSTTLARHITPTAGDMSFTRVAGELSARAAAKPSHCTTIWASGVFSIQIDPSGNKSSTITFIDRSVLTQLKSPIAIPNSILLFLHSDAERLL